MIAYDAPIKYSSPPWHEATQDEIDKVLVVALLTDYKTDPMLSIRQIERDFEPVFDHIIEMYKLERGDPWPTAWRVWELNGGPLYRRYEKRSRKTLDGLFEQYGLPSLLPRN